MKRILMLTSATAAILVAAAAPTAAATPRSPGHAAAATRTHGAGAHASGSRASSSVLYVSPGASPGGRGTSCNSAGFSSIQSAVVAAPVRSTVVVCRGTYAESVTIERQLTLQGRVGATIDATGQPYGIGIAASSVTVSGLTVENADNTAAGPADGIITAGFVDGNPTPADRVTIVHNRTEHNAGAGIDLNSTSYSVAAENRSVDNGIGINVSDDLGRPASHDRVSANFASDNPGGCGIVLAEHSGSGIYSNLVVGNTANSNGLGTPSAPNASSGSGIILASATSSGGVFDNRVQGNTFDRNGHAGVAMHVHLAGPDFANNHIFGNWIGVNNLRTDFADPDTTGIYLADVDPVTVSVYANTIVGDRVGIFTAGPVRTVRTKRNAMQRVAEPFRSVPTYSG